MKHKYLMEELDGNYYFSQWVRTQLSRKEWDVTSAGQMAEEENFLCSMHVYNSEQAQKTIIGHHDRQEYVSVGTATDLSAPGTVFSYASYVKMQGMNIKIYKEFYRDNLNGKVYTEAGGRYRVRN